MDSQYGVGTANPKKDSGGEEYFLWWWLTDKLAATLYVYNSGRAFLVVGSPEGVMTVTTFAQASRTGSQAYLITALHDGAPE